MSISSTLSNALSGLTASSRAAEIVSSNLANSMTEGYGRREISLSSQSTGKSGGVSVNGTIRHSNPNALQQRRLADAESNQNQTILSFQVNLETLVGHATDNGSLENKITEFEASLITAASKPESEQRLKALSRDGTELTEKFNAISDGVQSLRKSADAAIASDVSRLNQLLSQTQDLNRKIASAHVQGHPTDGHMDTRQRALDQISEIVPVQLMQRENGAVALYMGGGDVLLDTQAVEVEFAPSNVVTPHMTRDAGLLSGLSINGRAIDASSMNGSLSGGRLSAQFEVRDELAVKAQTDLDNLAADLVNRFQNPLTDQSLSAGQAGLFTDQDSYFDSANATGLAGRISLNSLVDERTTSDLWRLRDGLGATSAGDKGNAGFLHRMKGALGQTSGLLSGTNATVFGQASQLAASLGADRISAEEISTVSETIRASLKEAELSEGVDNDQELQNLLLIEQAYAANARIVQTVEEMMDTLLRI